MAKIPLVNFNSTEKRQEILQYYLDVFNEVPSGNHMIRAYTQMDKIFEELYKDSKLLFNGDELIKLVEKFDKIKALALGNANNHERKLAFYKSVALYIKFTGIKLTVPVGVL